MSPELSTLTFRVYRGIRTNINGEVDEIFEAGADNTAARSALHALAVDVRAKRSDDGLRRARGTLVGLGD